MTIQKLAQQYYDAFESATRNKGESFLRIKSEISDKKNYHESDLYKLIYDAHDDMAPDDYKYQFIHDALELIANNVELDDCYVISDVYTSQLLDWVKSHLLRTEYCDKAIAEYQPKTFTDILSIAQIIEKQEVFDSVKSSLETIFENRGKI